MSSDDELSADRESFVLHDAAEAGDVEALTTLLEGHMAQLEAAQDTAAGGGEGANEEDALPELPDDDPLLQGKDHNLCTPLHLAIINGHAAAAELLLKAKASARAACDGCPALHMAVCVGAHAPRRAASLALTRLLLRHGADVFRRDDMGRTALHWAAELGLLEVQAALLEVAPAAAAAVAAAAAEAAAIAGDDAPPPEPTRIVELQDTHGDTAVHLGARFGHADVVAALLAAPGGDVAADTRNRLGRRPLHAAAAHGHGAAAAALLRAHAGAADAIAKDGRTPSALAAARGHAALAAALAPGAADAAAASAPSTSATSAASTLIFAPPECLEHRTVPEPVLRGGGEHVPPENPERLRVITHPLYGCLRASEFSADDVAPAARLRWHDAAVRPAPFADILRVHDWAYVKRLRDACAALPDEPGAVARLDPDTAVSRESFEAARIAAAAACAAVDAVVTGAARHAFCAVRPPGHHAGPRGVVASANDPHGSHGFCLLNNVAVAAAYAVNVHRHAGVRRVAILDFDVHHGNGTEACVTATAPRVERFGFKTPIADGAVTAHAWAPWFDADDDQNILFASVQGYGPKHRSIPSFVYPGSGGTCDTRLLKEVGGGRGGAAGAAGGGDDDGDGDAIVTEPAAANGGAAAASTSAAAAAADSLAPEDPDGEFGLPAVVPADHAPADGPRVIDVGIPGPGFHTALWRRSWRDKVLPALRNFKPDLILISAGFDAHRKDDINCRYVGAVEADYEWLTDQIVQVANAVGCGGRIVSVLEGGYNLHGRQVSAFARSVAAHVRALSEPNAAAWDARESAAERAAERAAREDKAARLAAREKALAEAAERRRARLAAAAGGGGGGEGAAAVPLKREAAAAEEAAGTSAAAVGEPDGGGRAKRRRGGGAVDYAALNAQLEAEAAAAAKKE